MKALEDVRKIEVRIIVKHHEHCLDFLSESLNEP